MPFADYDLPSIVTDFDLVAISSYSAQIDEAYELARRYRNKAVPVVMGGPHVTALPDEALQFCDCVVIGEGEPVRVVLLDDMGLGSHEAGYLEG